MNIKSVLPILSTKASNLNHHIDDEGPYWRRNSRALLRLVTFLVEKDYWSFTAQLVSSVVFRPRPKVSGPSIEPTIDATKLNVPIINRQAFLDKINYLRVETANYYQIPNMHQLVSSRHLS